MLKIVSGEFKGSYLKSLKGDKTRPTLEKIRDCIFNVLSSRFDLGQFTAVDLFAGTGALGLEALSRGCASAVFVEKKRIAAQVIRENIGRLGLDIPVATTSALKWLKKRNWRGERFLFLLDPPYDSSLGAEALDALANQADILSGSVVVLESSAKSSCEPSREFQCFQFKRFGSTTIEFFSIS